MLRSDASTTDWALTPGQQRVRELAEQFVLQFRATYPLRDEPVCAEFRSVLVRDKIVREDSLTGFPLGKPRFSDDYLAWLRSISIPTINSPSPKGIRFDRVVIAGTAIACSARYGCSVAPACSGGYKRWHTVMQAVLSIVAGIPMNTHEMKITGYARSGILEADGGNNRLLGYLLTGEPHIPTLTWNEEQGDPDFALNHALLTIEDLYPAGRWDASYSSSMPTSSVSFGLQKQPYARLEEEIALARQFIAESTSEHHTLLRLFFEEWPPTSSEKYSSWSEASQMKDLLKRLGILRVVCKRSRIEWSIRAARRRLQFDPPPVPLVERWYEEHYIRNKRSS